VALDAVILASSRCCNCWAAGGSNADIGDELALSEATVKTHIGLVLDKLGVRDRVQAVIHAGESGLVEPGAARRA
jgi:DNA-binding NarL/FixJ family response regulator